jgi:hypothetical protein
MAALMGTPTDFEQQQQDLLQRRARYAQQQNINMPGSGQMVGNRFVATNPLNYLAEMLRGYGAQRGEENVRQELTDLAGKKQEALAKALRTSNEYMTGAPAVASKTTATEMPTFDDADAASMQGIQGYGATTGGQDAAAPDPYKAANALIESGISALQTAGINQQMEFQKTNAAEARAQANKARNMELWKQADGDAVKFAALGGDLAMAETMAKLPTLGKPKPIAVGNTLVDPVTFKPVFTAEPKVNMATDYLIPDGKGGYMPNTQLIQVKQNIQAAGRNPAPAKPAGADWKYDAGSDAWVKPPSAEFPMGQTTPNAGKAASFKNFNYLADNLAGADDKGGTIAKTAQGGYFGLGGALGSGTQAAKEFDNTVEQMSTELRTVFRIPGEGALSDKEQAQYGIQLPKRGNDPELNRKIVRDLRVRMGNKVDPQNANKPTTPQKTVVRTGTINGRKVVQYSDGTTDYAD